LFAIALNCVQGLPSGDAAAMVGRSDPDRTARHFCDLRRGLSARHSGQRLNLAIVQHRQPGSYLIARDTRKPGINDGAEHVEIDRLDDVIVGSQASPAQLIFTIGHRGQENERNIPEQRRDSFKRSSTALRLTRRI
jgi:hypothetical protein